MAGLLDILNNLQNRGMLNIPEAQDANGMLASLLRTQPQPVANGLNKNLQAGMNPYGARYAESPAAPLTMKGRGFFGEIPNAGGGSSTELSSSFDVNGQRVDHPLLVPTLTPEEIQRLVSGGSPTPEIYSKAQAWALQRVKDGQSPFAAVTDIRFPRPVRE